MRPWLRTWWIHVFLPIRDLDKQQILAQKVFSWRKKRMTRMNACEVAGSTAIVGIDELTN